MPLICIFDSLDELGSPVVDITCKPATCPFNASSKFIVGICRSSSLRTTSTELVKDDFFCVPYPTTTISSNC
ncbi:unknown [Bacteroides sp. CAG:189]|nr:unknown [Bacteroides sp. CAG:189]